MRPWSSLLGWIIRRDGFVGCADPRPHRPLVKLAVSLLFATNPMPPGPPGGPAGGRSPQPLARNCQRKCLCSGHRGRSARSAVLLRKRLCVGEKVLQSPQGRRAHRDHRTCFLSAPEAWGAGQKPAASATRERPPGDVVARGTRVPACPGVGLVRERCLRSLLYFQRPCDRKGKATLPVGAGEGGQVHL